MSNLSDLAKFGWSVDTSFTGCPTDRNLSSMYNITSLAAQLNMTFDRLDRIIKEHLNMECWNYALSIPKIPQQGVQGSVALILFTLMLATLWKLRKTFSPCTLIYHAATAIFEYPIAVNGIAIGFLGYYVEEPYYKRYWAFAIWRYYLTSGWAIADTFKLALSCLTFFLCVERFVAICFPLHFWKINRPVVAIGVVAFALLVGSAHLWNLMVNQVILGADGLYTSSSDKGLRWGPMFPAFYSFLLQFRASARLFFCTGIFLLCAGSVIGLVKRRIKIRAMSNATGVEEVRMFRATKLSLTIAACVMFDHVPWIANTYYNATMGDGGGTLDQIVGLSDEEVERKVFIYRVNLALFHFAVWGQWFLHGIRFLVYLAFNETMRDAFVRLIKRQE